MAMSTLRWLYELVEVAFCWVLFPLLCYQRATPMIKKGAGRGANKTRYGSGIGQIFFDYGAAQPLSTVIRGIYPGTKTEVGWNSKRDMPSLAGKVAIVTGGNAGIGFETVRGLLRGGAKVYIASRAHERSARAIQQLQDEIKAQDNSTAQVKLLPCDLLDLSSVARAANDFLRQESQLHILICNAGIVSSNEMKSAQGYEGVFATNVLGHHLFVEKLVPVLSGTAKATGKDTRVCCISSMGHNLHHPLGFDPSDPEYKGPVRATLGVLGWSTSIPFLKYGTAYNMVRYGHSKFLNAVQAKVYARKYGQRGIIFTSVDPGTNLSEIVLRERTFIVDWMWRNLAPLLAFHTSYGATSQLWATTSDAGAKLQGQHIIPWACVRPAARLTTDTDMQDAFYAYCEEQRTKHGF